MTIIFASLESHCNERLFHDGLLSGSSANLIVNLFYESDS